MVVRIIQERRYPIAIAGRRHMREPGEGGILILQYAAISNERALFRNRNLPSYQQ
jgi:hypothetical protein